MSEEAAAEADSNESAEAKINIDKIVDSRGVPLGNLLAEITRKLGRTHSDVSAKLDVLMQQQAAVPAQSPDKGADADMLKLDPAVRRAINSVREEIKQDSVEKAQDASLEQVFKTFPELLKSSDDFDQDFFEKAVAIEKTLDRNDPERPMKAAKLAALEVGKLEKLTKAKVIADENRRTRMLAEGGSPSKDASKQNAKSPKSSVNKAAVQRWFKIDPAKVEKQVKEYFEEGNE